MTNEEIDKLIEETYADSGLGRWFKEKWVDISRKKGGKHPPCGRSKATDSSYPKCRPSKKVSNKTPKTTKGMSTKDKKKAVNIKRRAEAPVSTVGAGRSPVMTKLKEGIEDYKDAGKRLNNIIQMPYTQFIQKYNTVAKDSKVRTLLKYGRKDGKPEDEVVRFTVREISVQDLIPTQNEIDIDQSLRFTVAFPKKAEVAFEGNNIMINNQHLITANGKYIIDGHHRWSSVYCLNKNATMSCLDMEFLNYTPEDFLKITQLAIAADTVTLPINNVKGSNLLLISEDEIKDKIVNYLSEESFQRFLELTTKFARNIGLKTLLKTREDIADYLWENVSSMQQNNKPVPNAPKRNFMPQTGKSKNWSNFLKSGEINFIDPDVLAGDLQEAQMKLDELNEDQTAVSHMYVFDFDDTIAETHSMVYVVDTRTGEEEKISPAAFAVHDKQPHQAYDFREFEEVVGPVELENTISAFSEILNRMETAAGKDSVHLSILTARGPGKSGKTGSNIRAYLLNMFTKLLQKTGREDKINNWTSVLRDFEIVTLGANRPEEKSRWILDKANLFPNLKTVVFYDDSVRNRNAFDSMKDELEGRGIRAAVYDPTRYTYDPEHLAEAEVELESGQKMAVCESCLREYIEEHKNVLTEAKYKGREVPLGKPMKGDVKKSKVYVKNPATGKVVKVNFGDKNMKIKKSNPKRRKSFRARHNCANPGPRTKARYWSCRAWEGKKNDDSKLLESIKRRMIEIAGLTDYVKH
jgi:hypothetical protein